MTTQTKARRLSDEALAVLSQLSLPQRQQAINFISPNAEPLTNEGVLLFGWMLRDGIVAFADQGTANEHLHVPPSPGFPISQFCAVCAYVSKEINEGENN